MQRTIKSFVHRAGRMSPRQQFGLEQLMSRYMLSHETSWNFAQIFTREANTIIEIGFGMGASLLTMALENPDTNFIGIEVHRPGVGSLAADIHEHQLENIRIASFDAVALFKQCVPDNSLAGIQIFFPDPWPKKRHHKRRLIQADFISLLVKKLKPDGFIHCATDWQEYAEQMLTVLSAEKALKSGHPETAYLPRPDTRPLTKFEKRGLKLGHGVWDLKYIKA